MRSADDDDFTDFVRSAGPGLLRVAILLAGDVERGQDLLQDALTKTYPRWPQVRSGQPAAYVRTAMANSMASWWRSPRSRAGLIGAIEESVPDETDRIAGEDAARRLLKELPPRTRTVLVLRIWSDLSEAQTAAELGCSVGTVKSHMSRGLARLRASEARLTEIQARQEAK